LRIDQFNLTLRRRQAAEAIDLGGVIADHWRRDALVAWGLIYWPVGLVIGGLVMVLPGGVPAGIVWWLKPWFDRVLLHFYSRAVFGERPGALDAVKAAFAAFRTRGLWADLTYRRFAFARSFDMPVTVLEGQTGAVRSRRIEALSHETRGAAVWLTFVCLNFRTLVALTILFTGVILIPGGIPIEDIGRAFAQADSSAGLRFALLAVSMLAETLVEPFYVAAGFSLYLNRRSELEGWDLELAFRRMADRLAQKGAVAAGLLALTLFATLGLAGSEAVRAAEQPGILPSSPARAAPPAPVLNEGGTPGGEKSAATMRTVLSANAFGHDEQQWVWRGRLSDETPPDAAVPAWLVRFLGALGGVIKWLALLVGAGCLLLAALWLVSRVMGLPGWYRPGRQRPDFVGGLDVRADSLPADPVGAALALVRAGEARRALSLLYRACLVALIDRAHIEFQSGDTEGSCLLRVEGRVPAPTLAYLRALVNAWLVTAYAHRPPPSAELEQLCAGWSGHFGSAVVLTGGPTP
jgi:hypothetical protein